MPRSLLFICTALAGTDLDRDPQAHKPYELQVVLRMAPHPLLTASFRQQVERQLRDSLQNALGDLAIVQVLQKHPLLHDVEAKGLEHAFDDWKSLDGRKLHFVFIDFIDGGYNVQSRQYDGFTGLASPVVRHDRTADRGLVWRTASLLVVQDFGLTGTVTGYDAKDRIEVTLKGGELPVSLGRWLKKDDVLAVAEIQEQGTKQPRSTRVRWLFLQATEEPHGGRITCQVHHRYDPGLGGSRSLYRCMRLGTIDGPVRLRLVAEGSLPKPLRGQEVQINPSDSLPMSVERKSTDADGLVQSDHRYHGLALVRIAEGGKTLANVPVPIVDDHPLAVAIRVEPRGEEVGKLYLDRDRWVRRGAECLDTSAAMIRDLNALAERHTPETSLATAKACLKNLQEEIANVGQEQDRLRNSAASLLKDKPLDLADGERQIKELRSRRQQLENYVSSIEETIKNEKDPKRIKLRELAGQARLLEGQAEYERAIALYREVLEGGGEDPQLRKRLSELEEAWAVKDDVHRQARDFIYRTWASAQTASQMKSKLKDLRHAFEVCREANDRLTPQKLLLLNLGLVAKLEKEAESLHPQDNDDDRRTAETIVAITKDLKTLNDDVAAYLRPEKKDG